MDEFSLINKIKPNYYRQSSLIKGVGDDAAVFRETQENLVTATDIFVEDIHFSRKTMNAEQIGYRLLAVNLSDLAAMGSHPLFYLVSIVVPNAWKDEVPRIFAGMEELAKKYKMDLIGGDTVSGNQLIISMNVIGKAKRNKVRYRSSAKPSDIVFVTGTLGDSMAGLCILQNKTHCKNINYFINRHRYPRPRIEFALQLQNIDRIALNDISDGLASEAAEIATASKLDIMIEPSLIPTSEYFIQFSKDKQYKWKLYGGEDFELLGVTSPANWNDVLKAAKQTNTPVQKIGYADRQERDDTSSVYLIEDGKKKMIKNRGYTHLT